MALVGLFCDEEAEMVEDTKLRQKEIIEDDIIIEPAKTVVPHNTPDNPVMTSDAAAYPKLKRGKITPLFKVMFLILFQSLKKWNQAK